MAGGLVLLPGLPYLARQGLAQAVVLLCVAWIYSRRHLPPGWPRFLAALPVLAVTFLLPFLFHPQTEFLSLLLAEFTYTRLTNCKVLAWAVNRGPLSRPWTFAQFTAVMSAPIIPEDPHAHRRAGRHHRPPQQDTALRMAGRSLAKLAVVGAGAWMLQRPGLPGAAAELMYALGLYAVLSLVMDGLSALITVLLGFGVAPHFDQPWLAHSVADFWARRWDVVVGCALRDLLYDPILEGRLVQPSKLKGSHGGSHAAGTHAVSARRRFVGMAACFLGSAAVHELEFWYFKGHWSGGRYGGFFLAQIPMMAAERWTYVRLRSKGVQVPLPLRIAATAAFLLISAHYLFWAPAKQEGVLDVAVAGVSANVAALAAMLGIS